MDFIDIKNLNKYERKKLVKKSSHPVYEIYIWNYTDIVQYKDSWNDELLICRGLVTDYYGNIIARSFKKFFNLEQNKHDASPNYRVFDKIDVVEIKKSIDDIVESNCKNLITKDQPSTKQPVFEFHQGPPKIPSDYQCKTDDCGWGAGVDGFCSTCWKNNNNKKRSGKEMENPIVKKCC